jgi:hypothetical protein
VCIVFYVLVQRMGIFSIYTPNNKENKVFTIFSSNFKSIPNDKGRSVSVVWSVENVSSVLPDTFVRAERPAQIQPFLFLIV